MKKNNVILILGALLIIIVLYFSYSLFLKDDKVVKSLTTEDIDTDINTDDDDEKISWDNYEAHEEVLTESIKITESGTYTLTGNIDDGAVTVNTTGNVKLVLNNVNIKNSNGPAIIIEQAETVLIYLEENSNNYLEDGSTYSNLDEDVNGVIYSKDDIVFDGTGKLTIVSNYQDGIVSKDDLKIIKGTYSIESIDDAIRGKDSVYILDGNFDIKSGGDAIKTTNEEDSEKGYVLIDDGIFNIEAELDGISAVTKLVIKNGEFNITTGGGSGNDSTSEDWGDWGTQPGYGRHPMQDYSNDDTTASAKGLKALDNLVIENGTLNLNTSDDAIHSNNYVGITNGNIDISSGDDGIHADKEIIIDNGNINITKSYEGIEAAKITINGGNISLVASDDGINVAGGMDSSGMSRPGQNNYSSDTDNILTINNGTIYVNATGDGIDINGSGYVYGGDITVDGPTNSGNGSLDYDREFIVNGGTFIAAGSSGMMQTISSSSTQYNVAIVFSSTYQDKKISIVDSNNNEVISYTPSKSFSSIVISSKIFAKNSTYTIKVDEEDYSTFTISSISTSVGRTSMGGQGGPGGQGGNPHRR